MYSSVLQKPLMLCLFIILIDSKTSGKASMCDCFVKRSTACTLLSICILAFWHNIWIINEWNAVLTNTVALVLTNHLKTNRGSQNIHSRRSALFQEFYLQKFSFSFYCHLTFPSSPSSPCPTSLCYFFLFIV